MRKVLIIWLGILLVSCFDEGGFSDGGAEFAGGDNVSQGGSYARFTVVGEYLYIVNDFSLIPVSIADLSAPVPQETIDLGIGIETIFPYGDNLFIGSSSAVYIFDISNPSHPILLSVYEHSTGCDPVVVEGNYAYVTLREGVSCGNWVNVNVLEVVNIANLQSPQQVNSIWMDQPKGLGLGCDNKLFVCDAYGLVQFDLTDPAFPQFERSYEYQVNDVIIRDDLLIATGDNGIYQFRCGGDSLAPLSVVPLSY